MKTYDFLVIGGGIAGYSAALKVASEMSVAIVEMSDMGGTCLNRGCIPTKKFRQISALYDIKSKSNVKNKEYVKKLESNEEKNYIAGEIANTVNSIRTGLVESLEGAKIVIYHGKALASNGKNEIVVKNESGEERIGFRQLLIATGSKPALLDICNPNYNKKISSKCVFTSDSAFGEDCIAPSSILVIGGGIIGIEFAFIYSKLGVSVTVVEQKNRIATNFSEDVSRTITKMLRKRGVTIITGVRVEDIFEEDDEVIVTIENVENADDVQNEILVDRVLVAVGRTAVFDDDLVKSLDVTCDGGKISVDKKGKTSNDRVFAAGDVCSATNLAYVASRQGEIVADNILNYDNMPLDSETATTYDSFEKGNIPVCIYSDPEVAQVGICEDFITDDKSYTVFKYSLKGNGMAIIKGGKEGYVKIIAETDSGVIAGVELICPEAVEIVSICKEWIDDKKTIEYVSREIFPHPSVTEALKEAAKTLMTMRRGEKIEIHK